MKKLSLLSALLCATMMSFAVDWSGIEWLADGAGDGAFANKYKVAAAFGQNVVNIQKPGFAAEAGIYTNFPAGISSCSLPDGKYVIEGAGMILYLTAFTAKETAVSVEAGGSTYDFTVFYADGTGEVSGGGSEPDPDPDPHQGDLTPATYYGYQAVEVNGSNVMFEWSITRNADATLTFELSWSSDIVGSVPQVCINGVFTTMPAQGNKAVFTTKETFKDGATLSDTFFYMAYAGGAARIEITGYTVGASNEPQGTTGVESVYSKGTRARKVVEKGQIVLIKNGVRYNMLGTEIK